MLIISVFLVANTPISRFVENAIKNREKKKMLAEMNRKYEEELLASAEAEQLAINARESSSPAPRSVAIVTHPAPSSDRRKGIRAIDMQDTIVMTP